MRTDTTTRAMRWPDDAASVAGLVADAWNRLGPNVSMHPGDFFWRAHLREGRDFQVWEDEAGAPVGLAEVDVRDSSADIVVRPDRIADLERGVFRWIEDRLLREPGAAEVCFGCFSDNPTRHALLTSMGYRRTGHYYPHFHRELPDEFPAQRNLGGYRVRVLAGPADVPERIELGRLAFGRTSLTPENYGVLWSGPGYDPDLDLVAEAPDGSLAAFCLCWRDDATGVGEFEPVGVHPGHRRRGLGAALVVEGLRRLRERGSRAAIVTTGSKNSGARTLYESCGFSVTGEDYDYVKSLGPSAPA